MENPVSGMELVVGIVTGALGYTTADVLDRLVTMRERKDDKGQPIAMRFIEAPLMDDLLPRVGTAVAVAGVPLVAAQFISSPMGRSALQFFGFGAAVRFVGKVVDDVAAYLFKDSAPDSMGKKLFAGEIGQRAAVGLGAAPCPNCGSRAGLGACGCRSMLPQMTSTLPIQPSPVQSTIPPGGGQPPVVNQGPPPPGYVPPITTIPTQPVTPLVPRVPTTVIPTPPAVAPQSPIAAMPLPQAPVGINGLGDVGAAKEVLRSHGQAYVALRKNRDLLAAASNGSATPAQKAYADKIVAQHRGSFSTLQQFHPTVLDTAARGLGLVVDEGPTTWPGASRHRSDEAAE